MAISQNVCDPEIAELVSVATSRFLKSMRISQGLSLKEACEVLGYSNIEILEQYENCEVSISAEELCRALVTYRIPEPNETLLVFMYFVQSKIEDHWNETYQRQH